MRPVRRTLRVHGRGNDSQTLSAPPTAALRDFASFWHISAERRRAPPPTSG
jgi:hypothetical protein